MQYTELTRKELQREYTRMTQRYSSYMREPMELDMRAEDPLLDGVRTGGLQSISARCWVRSLAIQARHAPRLRRMPWPHYARCRAAPTARSSFAAGRASFLML